MPALPTSAIARDALEKIAANIAYIRGELPGLTMPDDIRLAILSACARFDATVKWVVPGESAGMLSPMSDALQDMRDRVDLYVYGDDAGGLLEAMEAMHAVVMRLQGARSDDFSLHVVYMLVSESAANILNAYSIFRAMTDRTTPPVTSETVHREGDFGQIRPMGKHGESV